MTFYILDTETTGVSKTDQVIELAYLKISDNVKTLAIEEEYVERFNPDVPINQRAFEVHGIDKRSLLRDRCKPSKSLELPKDIKYMLAHNASFDKRLLEQTISFDKVLTCSKRVDFINMKVICSIKLIKNLEKIQGGTFGFENYQLNTIFTHWFPEETVWQKINAHSALGDCIMLRKILLKSLECFPHVKDLESLFKLAKLI